jgi:membrane protease YdiL (CAAX protease family)
LVTGEAVEAKLPPVTGISYWQRFFIILIFLGITICEYVFAYQDVAYGIGIALGLVIIINILLSVLHFHEGTVKIAESLLIIPLYILFTSSLPWFFISQDFLLPAVYSCVLAICFWHIYHNNINLWGLMNADKSKFVKYLLISLAIGIPTGTIEYLILKPSPAAPVFTFSYFIRDTIYMVFFVGLAEELLFRGLIQQDISDAFGWKWALVSTSALFAVMHLTWRSIPELGFVFIAGLIMGGMYIKTKGLVAPILFHAINNIMLVSVAPYIYK